VCVDQNDTLADMTCFEAAAWLVRLHGPYRTPRVEAGLRKWLSGNSHREQAFELLTQIWEQSGQLRR